ncbi:MAG: thiamine-phosphate kinase [Syntrophus sp. (in: bacteria)]|nr:thiamine-phosphate kinase [Syntrophus sp. (in: bacteria)]
MEISENNLIKKLKKFGKTSDNVLRGIGDDGAVVTMSGGQYVLVQDAMVEHVHFEFSFLDPYYVGKKAIAVNVSDILAMGALPLYFLVTIGVPARMSSPDIERLYKGMKDASRALNIILLGGDTVGADSFFIDVSMVGKLVTKKYLGRDKAQEGDLIAVTGYLGEAAYGLHLLQKGITETGSGKCLKRFMDPRSPYTLWKELIKHDITVAMMDISDGLIIDLERMMAESKKTARLDLENIPVPAILRKKGMEKLALTGGEDYQLLFTFPQKKLPQVKRLQREGHKISVIGKVAKGKGVKVFKNGKEILLTEKGYQHFNEEPHE